MSRFRRRFPEILQGEAAGKPLVVFMDRLQQQDQNRDQDQNDPGSLKELGDGEDHYHDGGAQGAETVDDHLQLPLRLMAQRGTAFFNLGAGPEVPDLPPAARHACLRQGEGQEYADGIQRNQAGDAGIEGNDQQRCDQSQRDDAA